MSYENRKRMYDQLVAAERYEHICQSLKDEFGDPIAKDSKTDVNYSDMTKDQLKKHCKKENLNFPEKATKDDLVVLLETKSDEVKA